MSQSPTSSGLDSVHREAYMVDPFWHSHRGSFIDDPVAGLGLRLAVQAFTQFFQVLSTWGSICLMGSTLFTDNEMVAGFCLSVLHF